MSRKDEDSELGFWCEPITRDQMRTFWNELGKVSTYPGEAEWPSRLAHSAKNKSTTFVVKGNNMCVSDNGYRGLYNFRGYPRAGQPSY